MSQPRRLGAEGSKMRARFVDAAERLLCEEGASALSARAVAARAELKTQLLYYYFRSMDDLILAVVARVNDRRMARFEAALVSPEPLRALWNLNQEPTAAILGAELGALANRREVVRVEIVEAAARFRLHQIEAARRLLPPPRPGDVPYSAEGLVMIAAALSRMLSTEAAVGLTVGHTEALAIVEDLLARFQGTKPT